MSDQTNGSDSLTNFKRKSAAIVKQLRRSGRPLVLTVNGEEQLVVQDVGSYRKLLEVIDRFQAVEGIRRGLEDMKAGKGRPAAEVFEEIRKKYQIPRD